MLKLKLIIALLFPMALFGQESKDSIFYFFDTSMVFNDCEIYEGVVVKCDDFRLLSFVLENKESLTYFCGPGYFNSRMKYLKKNESLSYLNADYSIYSACGVMSIIQKRKKWLYKINLYPIVDDEMPPGIIINYSTKPFAKNELPMAISHLFQNLTITETVYTGEKFKE